MNAKVRYFCNFCHNSIDSINQPSGGVGLLTKSTPWQSCRLDQSETHLCNSCYTELQNMEPVRCIGGFHCNGGPTCTSSHK